MKHRPHQKEKKALSVTGLLGTVRKIFTEIAGVVRSKKISLSDCFMSALAMFSLKSPSLLAFDKQRAEKLVAHNLKHLYGISDVPCDTHMREMLDKVDPRTIRECFLSVFHEAQRGKLLERYKFQDGYLCLVDGTEIFNSEKIHCKHCCKKEHKDGRITYHHQMLGAVIAHPDLSQVIPFCPEPILKQDGVTKNDCERNAFHRFLVDLKREHPRLKLTICSDALSATAPHINELKDLGYDFIVVAKPEGNRSLYEFVKGIKNELKMTVGRNKYTFWYVNNVPLNETKNAPNVNFLECEWEEVRGISGKTVHKGRCGWAVSHEITVKNIYELVRGGRARWKIENETFNTLKNQGYQFEHNFGHGKNNLHTVFAFLMMLAFLIDQIQEATCGLFQAAMQHMQTRRAFWEKMRGLFYLYYVKSWTDLFEALTPSFKGATLGVDTS